jgi:hypothetical protein
LSDLTEELERIGVGRSLDLLIERDGRRTTVPVEVADVGGR